MAECHHCGFQGPDDEEHEHSCPCPYPDADCPDHPLDVLRVLHATCLHCKETRVYAPTAMHLALQTNGVTALEFFCTACHEYNRQAVRPIVGELLAATGVPTTFVDVPLELLEHPPAGFPPVTSVEVELFAERQLETFNRLLRFELGDKRVGDVEPG